MNKRELPAETALPRPIVLRPEDLARVAAAGVGCAPVAGKILIAGGIPAGGPSLA